MKHQAHDHGSAANEGKVDARLNYNARKSVTEANSSMPFAPV